MQLPVANANTIGLWQLQGNLNDSSGNGLTLSMLAGTAAYTTLSGSIQGFNFNGARTLRSVADPLVQIEGELTIELLLMSRISTVYTIFDVEDSGADVLYSFYFSAGGLGNYGISYVDQAQNNDIGTPSPPGIQPSTGVIEHWTFRRKLTSPGNYIVEVFKNGVLQSGSLTAVDQVATGAEFVHIGGFSGGPLADGIMAGVHLMSGARSDADIAADYNYVFASPATAVNTAAAYISSATFPVRPFYYLKINGLPYYFGSTIDPTSSAYGSAAWTLPTGMTWVKGMDIPSSSFDQSLPDLIGGIASAEKVKVSVLDFDVHDTNGKHPFFGRLLSPGRITTSLSAKFGTLASNITATQTSGAFDVVANGAAFTTGDTYVGGETIGIGGVDGPFGNTYTLTISDRNKYPCNDNYPPRRLFRVEEDDAGSPDPKQSVIVTQGDPITIIGRAAALYIGALKPDGTPEPESNSLCRLIGHVRGYSFAKEPGKYEFEIDSVIADIEKSMVAPYLAQATIKDGIYLPAGDWQKIGIRVTGLDHTSGLTEAASQVIQVTQTYYATMDSLLQDIDTQLGSGGGFDCGGTVVHVRAARSDYTATLPPRGSPPGTLPEQASWSVRFLADCDDTADQEQTWSLQIWFAHPDGVGLASALGFSPMGGLRGSPGLGAVATIDTNGEALHIELDASRPAARVFFPLNVSPGQAIDLVGTNPGDAFFTDQGDGSGTAYVRLSDGQVQPVTGTTATSLTIFGFNFADPFYYCSQGDTATLEQVIHLPSGNTDTGEEAILQFLGSKGYDGDGDFNVFPEGVGLGYVDIMDTDSIRANFPALGDKNFSLDVDRTTKFSELWQGTAKLFGLFIVWDVENAQVALRCLQSPSASLASSFVFSESNRQPSDSWTRVSHDQGQIRTGWAVKSGYDYREKKYVRSPFVVNDNGALSTYALASRTETIEDRLVQSSDMSIVRERYTPNIINRLRFTQAPWSKLIRTTNKTGLLLTPGNHHKIIDATVNNPFTGQRGIDDDDDVYCFIYGVRMNYAKGESEVTLMIDQLTDSSVLRPWSPVALVDFGATSNGYDNGTGVLTLTNFYTAQAGMKDGIDFLVGDKVYLTTRQNDGAPGYTRAATVSAIATDGSTMTVDAGLGAVSSTVETIVVLQDWGSQTAARKTTAATRVSFQGDGDVLVIDGTDRLHKWT